MTEITMYGADWCPDCVRAKNFLQTKQIDFNFINIDLNEAATRRVEAINKGKRVIPTFYIGESHYTNPDNNTLAKVLGINQVGRVLLFGADWCPDCRRAKNYLNDNHINYMFIDVDKHQWATDKVEQINKGKRIIPTILIDDVPYTNPDNARLKYLLKIDETKSHQVYDTIIVGGGAAGLTTSIYAQRDKFNTLVLEKRNIGGNAYLTERIENYPGFKTISGPDLMDKMAAHAKVYGATIKEGTTVKNIDKAKGIFTVSTDMGNFFGKSVVLAVGSTYRKLHIPGEDSMIGSGVHFCATCDGAFYRDKEVVVIGGGNTALEEGIFLAGFCKKVKIVNHQITFSASETYIEKLPTIDNIEIYMNKTSLEFLSDDKGLFSALKIKDNETGEQSLIESDGVFVFIGLIPNTDFIKNNVALDSHGFVDTKSGNVSTDVPGIFAAGDCRRGAIAQVAAATGEGVMASYAIRSFLKDS